MPSLQELEEFKASFGNIGGELLALKAMEQPPDDFPLPAHEPVAPAGSPDDFPQDLGSPEESDLSQPADLTEMFQADNIASGDGLGDDQKTDLINFGDLSDLLGGMDSPVPNGNDEFPDTEASAGQEDMEFGAFIDNIPDDFASQDSAGGEELSAEEDIPIDGFEDADIEGAGAEDAGVETAIDDFNLDDLSLEEEVPSGGAEDAGIEDAGAESDIEDFNPPDLLDGFADEIEAERSSAAEQASAGEDETGIPSGAEDEADFGDSGELDLESFPEIDTSEALELAGEEAFISDTGEASDAEEALPAEDGFESGAAAGEDFQDLDLGDFPDINTDETLDLAGEEGAAFDAEEAIPAEDGLEDLPEADADESLELAGEETGEGVDTSATEVSGEADGFDMGGEVPDFDTGAILEEISGDSFDNFKLDTDTLAEDFDLGGGEAGGIGDEFSLSGVDSLFDGKSAPLGAGGVSARAAARADREAGEEADEVEEIRLSDEELEQLQTTLSSYPLNLRIACEELIAEHAVEPDKMSQLVKLLIGGASARETASLAGKILNRSIPIPRGFEKKTGAALEAEQTTFAYIFVHNFLPFLRLFMMITLVILSAGYLSWRFIYTPLRAEKIYKLGIERIAEGEYGRANERFREAFRINQKKSWFYEYARAFREARQYTLAEEKYQELLGYTAAKNKRRIPEKAAVLEYANMETNVIGNYQKADQLLRRNILDYYPVDREALLALGDNSLAWGDYEPARLEDARESYARVMERYGRSDPLLERMLLYFIRTDNLEETLSLQLYFMASEKRKISAAVLAELGGYLLDKRFEKIRGVPNAYLDYIGGIREILLRAIKQNSMLPESYYHLARYYNHFENFNDERITLDVAVRVFEAVKEESPKRMRYHINTLQRYSEILIGRKEFFPAEENLIKGINIYQDGLSRRLLTRSPEFGRLYASMGDLEYFVKDGAMRNALDYYRLAEQNGWAPPEIQYRMGAALYQLREWGPALDRLFAAYREMPPNRRVLYALGNVSYMRGNYFAAQGYYDRLLEILNADRDRLPPITPTDDEKQLDLAERLMIAQNNLGVALEALTERTGNHRYRSRAQGLYSDSARAWDILTRNPQSMIRMRPTPETAAPSVNPAYLNVRNNLNPVPGYEPFFFMRIDKDIFESSAWEDLATPGYRLSEGIDTGR